MGNESSRDQQQQQQLNSPTTSAGTGGGLPASFSFLAKKRNSTSGTKSSHAIASSNLLTNSIVVVNEGASTSAAADPSADPDLRRIKEIPRFLPLLRGVLPAHRDLPDIHQKVDSRPIHRFLGRLQQHSRHCADTVTSEQGRIFAHIVEVDQLLSSLVKKTATGAKKLEALGAELRRTDALAEQLENTQVLFHELARSAESMNLLLPKAEQLAPLSLALQPLVTERRQRQGPVVGKSIGANAAAAGKDGRRVQVQEAELLAVVAGARVGGRAISECRVVDSDDGLLLNSSGSNHDNSGGGGSGRKKGKR